MTVLVILVCRNSYEMNEEEGEFWRGISDESELSCVSKHYLFFLRPAGFKNTMKTYPRNPWNISIMMPDLALRQRTLLTIMSAEFSDG